MKQREGPGALRQSAANLTGTAALLRAVLEQMQDAVLAETPDRTILFANAALCTLFNLAGSPCHLSGQRSPSVSPELAAITGELAALSREGAASAARADRQIYERRLPSGVRAECCYTAVQIESGEVHVWQFHDITDRRGFEEELQRSRQRLRELTAHLETVREEERRGLAQALHDEVGQTLTGIRLELARAIDEIRHADGAPTPDAIDRLQAAVGLLDLSLDAVRRVSTALRPPLLDQFGLVSAIKWEAAVFERRTGIRCRVRCVPPRIQVPPSHVTVFYRILLEALTNVARHAQAGAVDIRLRRRPGVAQMEVHDNGRGITDREATNPDTMGLLGMRERALTVGGDVRVTRAPGGGTSVLVILPLPSGEAGTE